MGGDPCGRPGAIDMSPLQLYKGETHMLLANLRGFITGAGTGIGRAIALEMVREGADLAITDLDLASAQKVAGEAQALRADARVWAGQLDVRDTASVAAR